VAHKLRGVFCCAARGAGPLACPTLARSAYDCRFRYDQPLAPPLRPTDEPWVRESLAGTRSCQPNGLGIFGPKHFTRRGSARRQ